MLVFLFFNASSKSRAQVLYLQENFRGGASVDGKSNYGFTYLNPDTINFTNTAPTGSTIKKSFLIGMRYKYIGNSSITKDSPLQLLFNNNQIQFDSSNIAASYMCNLDRIWISVKDVTTYTHFNNNKLIIPSQNLLLLNNPGWNFTYDGFLLVILYEDNTMPSTNLALILNNSTINNNPIYSFNSLNPMNNLFDVGLSIWDGSIASVQDSVTINLTSTLNTFRLGALYPPINSNNISKLPGSFYYQNNTLFGLQDDSPNPFIDSTDALANIKSYILNNSTSYILTGSQNGNNACNLINTFILAYSTPCPTSSNKDTAYTYYICSGINKTLAVNSSTVNTSYSWYATDGSLTSANTASVIVTPTVSTNYIAYVDSAGCKHTEHFSIAVTPSPKFDSVSVTNAICGGALGSVTVSPGYGGANTNYYYSVGAVILRPTNTFSNIAVGTYSATVTDTRGCSYSKTFSIIETNQVTANFKINSNRACINEPVQILNTSTGTNMQLWNFGTTLTDTSNMQNPAYIYSDTGTYSITLISYNNLRMCSDTLTRSISVKECPPDSINVIVPNVFSPNADDINDSWQLIVYNFNYTISNFECVVYDRWGMKVFETNSLNQAWDGRTTSGLACSAGAYYYVIKLTATNSMGVSESKDYKGFLELVR